MIEDLKEKCSHINNSTLAGLTCGASRTITNTNKQLEKQSETTYLTQALFSQLFSWRCTLATNIIQFLVNSFNLFSTLTA